MNLELQREMPKVDGLYIVFVSTAVKPQWKEPHIVLRLKGEWLHRNSNKPYLDHVCAWFGPLPALSDEIIATEFAQEYDL